MNTTQPDLPTLANTKTVDTDGPTLAQTIAGLRHEGFMVEAVDVLGGAEYRVHAVRPPPTPPRQADTWQRTIHRPEEA